MCCFEHDEYIITTQMDLWKLFLKPTRNFPGRKTPGHFQRECTQHETFGMEVHKFDWSFWFRCHINCFCIGAWLWNGLAGYFFEKLWKNWYSGHEVCLWIWYMPIFKWRFWIRILFTVCKVRSISLCMQLNQGQQTAMNHFPYPQRPSQKAHEMQPVNHNVGHAQLSQAPSKLMTGKKPGDGFQISLHF